MPILVRIHLTRWGNGTTSWGRGFRRRGGKRARTARVSIDCDTTAGRNGLSIAPVAGVCCAGIALVVSTFASSTLFTIIVSLVVYFIGHAQSLALEYYFPEGQMHGAFQRFLAGIVAVVFPNLQMCNIFDGIITGQAISTSLLFRLIGLTGFYLAIYSMVSWILFAKKEL